MNSKMRKYIFAIALASLLFANAYAQNKDDKGYNESVIMRSSFSPVVSEAYKLGDKPSVVESEFVLPSFSYDKTTKRFPTTMNFEKIKPAKVKGEPIAMLYNTHLKAAVGTYFSSLVDASYSQTRSKDFVYSINFKHRSSIGQIKDYANSSFANNNLNLYAKKIWSNYAADARLFYEHQRYYYYGFADSLNKEKKDYRTPYHSVGGSVGFTSLNRQDTKWQSNALFEAKHTDGKWGNKETDLYLTAGMAREFSLFANSNQLIGMNVAYKQVLGKYAAEDFTPFFNPAMIYSPFDNTYGMVDIKAFMDFGVKQADIHASVSFVPTFGNSTSFYFLPTLVASSKPVADHFTFKGGLQSTIDVPTLHSLVKENPFMSPIFETKATYTTSLFARADYANSNNIRLNLETGYQVIDNKYFYTIDKNAALGNMFTLVYDDVKRFYAELNFDYTFNSVSIKAGAMFQNLTTDSIEAAWYTPKFKINMGIEYVAADKLAISLIPTFSSAVKCLDPNGETQTLSSKFDLNLSASYRYSEQMVFFVEFNNLAFQRYYEYYNYPSQRFVGMLGARIAF